MKIFIISTIRNAHVLRWARKLIKKDYDTTVISSEKNDWDIADIPVIECIAKKSRNKIVKFIFQCLRTLELYRIVRKRKPDIIHIHSLDYIHPFLIGLLVGFTNSFKNLIISTWGNDVISALESPSNFWEIFSKRYLLSKAKHITATSKFLADATSKLTSTKKAIHVVPFGVDCHSFRRLKMPTTDIIHIGFIKHLLPKYGPDYLIKAMAVVVKEEPNTHLTIVGHGWMYNELRVLTKRLCLEDNISFTGYIQYHEIPSILSNFHIMAMPSIENSETFGVAAIEAQAMQIPVVATDIGGISEAVLNGVTGILIEPGNVAALAKALIKLVRNKNLREKMGTAGRKYVLNFYDIDKNIIKYENLYRN